MIAEICPAHIGIAETAAAPSLDGLLPAERRHIAAAVDARRREFATVRRLARAALAGIGLPPAPLLPDARGAPRWPAGVVGSLTHCPGLCAAAVARVDTVRALGIDAEPAQPLPAGVLGVIATEAERRSLPAGELWGRLLFSAKEATFKAASTLTDDRLGLIDLEVRIDPVQIDARWPADAIGGFRARLPDGRHLTGRWRIHGGLLCTCVAVPA